MKLVISGGHLTPALALIDYINDHQSKTDLIFVGREFNRDSDKQPAQERDEVDLRNVKFIPIKAARLNLRKPLTLLTESWTLASSFFKSLSIMLNHKPDVFISFGGYLAFPLAVAAYITRIPIVIHEQTRAVGVSNQIVGHLAQKIAVSFPSSAKYFPQHKTVVTGNLVRPKLMIKNPARPSWIKTTPTLPILYITGGSQGSEVINMTIKNVLPQLTKNWQVIHQCGPDSSTRSYLTELEQFRQQLPKARRNRYLVRQWVTTEELAWIYKHARLVVSRAGANTTYELIFFAVPGVLIPLPFSHHDEQAKNAESLLETGGAIIIQQKNLTSESLLKAIDSIGRRYKACSKKLAQLSVIKDADKQLFELIQSVASN